MDGMGGVKSYRCDGIICLVHDDNLILCNPAIKEVRFLPTSGLLGSGYGCKGVGFEYDCRVNDYNVIIFAISFAWRPSFVSKLYSLSTNSWKEIKGCLDSQSIEVWVLMNDCLDGIGGDCTLIKQLVIEPVACPVAFWKSDEILMKSRKGKLVSYNLRNRKLRNICISGVDRIISWALVRSLVSVKAKVEVYRQSN
ncbi:hypothetical protein TIFTF001_013146 [Ficus carica]|uniref:F-box associated beta-propeller type 1 domain-containing protein n=1 Tax=Ficus carica TaxID=3494 RepID=A0AA88D5P9_FICCA|nr:hypothetical protein TIFTF001_013146 [Ficus carica]